MLDNASIHRSKATVDYAQTLDFTIIWNVPYHPEFNGIEYVWAIVKMKFRAIQTQRMLGTKECSFVDAIWESMSGVSDIEVKRCIQHGLSNLDKASRMLNENNHREDRLDGIPVVECSRCIS